MSMVEFQFERRAVLAQWPGTVATASETKGRGSRGNTAHLNLKTPIAPPPVTKKMQTYHDRLAADAKGKAEKKAKAAARRRKAKLRASHLNRLRRAMIMRELAMMGLMASKIAALLGVSNTHIVQMKKAFGFTTPKKKRGSSALFKAIRAGIEAGKNYKQIAGETGAALNTVKVYACEMKLTHGSNWPAIRRGFEIPEGRMAEYKELIRLGCTAKEAGKHMRLIAREPAPGATP